MLPDELLMELLIDQFPCRDQQIQQLLALYSPQLPSPPNLILHGLPSTGKSSITRAVSSALKVPFAIVDSRECITGRHLLEKTLAACLDSVEAHTDVKIDRSLYARCENLSALNVHLQRLLESSELGKFILIFDGIDKQREAPPTLLSALARFHESVPALSTIYILTHPTSSSFHLPGIPHISFPAYSRSQIITVLSRSPPQIFLTPPPAELEYTEDLAAEDNLWVWSRFLATVWDSLGRGAARDLTSFKRVATRLWRPFVQPIVDGTFGTRDFSRLMVHRRALFQSEDALLEKTVAQPKTKIGADDAQPASKKVEPKQKLPYYTTYILIAAYLASYNPSRTDSVYFMKAAERRRRKKGGGTSASGGPGRGRKPMHRKIPRHLLTPSLFTLDRLFAIFRAILPHSVPQMAALYTEIATLASLRLLLRSGVGAAGDVLEPGGRWRVNYGWDHVKDLGRSAGFEVSDFLAGGGD